MNIDFRKIKAKISEWKCWLLHGLWWEVISQDDDTIIYQCSKCKESHVYAHKRFL